MAFNLLPLQQFFDSSGNPLASGTLTAYEVGTTTKKAIYTSYTGGTESANPVTLDSAGRVSSAGIFGTGLYRLVVKDSTASTIWDLDSVGNTKDTSAAAVAGSSSSPLNIVNRLRNETFISDNNGFTGTIADAAAVGHTYNVLTQTTTVSPTQLTTTNSDLFITALRLTNGGSSQRIGLVSFLKGKDVTALRASVVQGHIYVRSSVACVIRVALIGQTTTVDSPTVDVVNTWTSTTYTAGSFFISGTLDQSSVSSVTLAADTWTKVGTSCTVNQTATNMALVVWTESAVAATSTTIDFSGAAVYESATTLTWRPDADDYVVMNNATLVTPTISGAVSGTYTLTSPTIVTPTITTPTMTTASLGDASFATDIFQIKGNATNAGRLRITEDTDNGTNYVEFAAPQSITANRTILIPDMDIANFILQRQSSQTGALQTGTTLVPFDDTIPQNTEGTEFITLAITPKSATSILVIEAIMHVSPSSGGRLCMALFQDTTADALACTLRYLDVSHSDTMTLKHTMTSGTTSATTFKIRIGSNIAGTVTLNGQASARYYGGTLASSIVIYEYAA